MSSGGSKQKSTTENRPAKEFEGAFSALGAQAEDLIGDVRNRNSFVGSSGKLRNRHLDSITARNGGFSGLDQRLLEQTFDTGGYTGFTADDLDAFNRTRQLDGANPLLGQAANRFKKNTGIDALGALDVNGQRDASLRALQGLDFDQLQQTARGDFLDVSNNPFLSDALDNAQRRTTDAFKRDVQPALAAQFGGGFGLSGSSSINAQRRAAEDLSRALSEQATGTYADQYNRERGFMEQARSQLGQLGLERAGQLGQLGLGFTNAGIDRGTALASGQLQQAQGIADVGVQQRQQELEHINLLGQQGAQQRQSARDLFDTRANAYDARIDDQIGRLQGIAGIVGAGGGGGGGSVTGPGQGGSRASGILGGALAGGSAGFALGGPFGGVLGAGIGGGLSLF